MRRAARTPPSCGQHRGALSGSRAPLRSARAQTVYVGALETVFSFEAGETIWTESSHKFLREELSEIADSAGFEERNVWIDQEWPFAEALWRVK